MNGTPALDDSNATITKEENDDDETITRNAAYTSGGGAVGDAISRTKPDADGTT